MKWKILSDESRALIEEMRHPFGLGRTTARMNRLRELCEPAAVINLMALITSSGSSTARMAASVLTEIVSRLPTEILGTLDERMRSDWVNGPARLHRHDVDRLQFQGDNPTVLGLASCNADGFARERAVLRLDREVHAGREIPFLLLRLNDWVDQVRATAERAIETRLEEAHRSAYLGCLPLVVRLQDRVRATQSRIFAKIKALLLSDPAKLVRLGLASTDKATRRILPQWAWASVPPSEGDRQRLIVEAMLQSIDPAPRLRVALWVSSHQMAPELAREIITRLVGDRFAAVRRASLAWQAAFYPEQCLSELKRALLDPSAIMRSVAQFFLPRNEPIDLRAFYRNALQQPLSRSGAKAALGGLAETGRLQDVELIVPFTQNTDVAIRSAAIRALGRLSSTGHIELLVDALQASSPGVSRAAREVLARRVALIGADRLAGIFSQARHRHVRVQALALITRLPKWQAVARIIESLGLCDEIMTATAEDSLRIWLRDFNRTHQIQPSANELACLRTALENAGSRLPHSVHRELTGLVAAMH